VPLQKPAVFEGCNHDIKGIALQCYKDEAECLVCNALHSRSLADGNTQYNQELIVKCFGITVHHVSSNDNSAMKFTENQEDD
jgi:hypothetical protein